MVSATLRRSSRVEAFRLPPQTRAAVHGLAACALAPLALLSGLPDVAAAQAGANPHCVVAGFAVSPSLTLTDATTKAQTIGGSVHLLISKPPNTGCGTGNRFDVFTNSKYDNKQKSGEAPVITRHHVARVQDLVFLPGGRTTLGLTGSFLADNSLGLYLQQTYTLALARTLSSGDLASEVSLGPAFVGQHFTKDHPSTGFVAPAASFTIDYTTPVDTTKKRRAKATEINVSMSSVIGLGHDARLSTGQLSISVPTAWSPLSLTVKTAYDYITNPPPDSKNHYLTLEFGPTLALGILQ